MMSFSRESVDIMTSIRSAFWAEFGDVSGHSWDKQLRDKNSIRRTATDLDPISLGHYRRNPFFPQSDCNRGMKMIRQILSHLLGDAGEDFDAAEDTYEELMEFDEGGWVIVNLPENAPLSAADVDPLENLLIEHPSMSVYQMEYERNGAEGEELGSEEDTSRPVAVRRHISWRLAAWGLPLPCNIHLLAVQRARTQNERKKLSRSALHRQNLAKTRFSPTEKRYCHFKQPCHRLYNY